MNATPVHEYAAALRRMVRDGTSEQEVLAAVDQVAATLLQSGRRSDLRRLLRLMEGVSDDGGPVTDVVTASPLPAATEARFGRHTRVTTDRALVAGARVQKGDRLIRSTLRDRLDTLLSPVVSS